MTFRLRSSTRTSSGGSERGIETDQVAENVAIPRADKDLPPYRYAKALSLAATSAAEGRTKTFKTNWDKFLGKNAWEPASSTAASLNDRWQFRGSVQWTFSTIKTKASMILGSSPQIVIDPLDDSSSYMDRLLVETGVEHLLAQARFDDVKRDAYLWGSVTGVGIAMWRYRSDPITGVYKLEAVPVRSDEFFRDPSADSITSPNCRYVVWYPELDMSTIREMWPQRADLVRPESQRIAQSTGFSYSTKGDANLIYGSGGEFQVDPKKLNARKARVCFVWIRDEDSLSEDVQKTIIKEAVTGLGCANCGTVYEDAPEDPTTCPMCAAELSPTEIQPANYSETTTVRRSYPYGRLIVYSGETLLYDGQNPCHIDSVFPFAVYHHDRVPGDFYGTNDVDLLDSLQDTMNRVIGAERDFCMLAAFGPFVYPMSCKTFTAMGNGPGERHPCPDQIPWQPHFVSPDGANIPAFQDMRAAIKEQFIIVSGLGGPSLGEVSSPPISATEAEIANARLSDRMKAHAREFSTFCSDFAEIGRQLAVQFLSEPQTVNVTFPDSTAKDLALEWQKLPNVRVRVEIDQEHAIKDKLQGQNLTAGIQSGILDSPYAELFLEANGISPSRIREVMKRKALAQEMGVPSRPPQLSLVPGGQGAVPTQ